MTNPFRLDAHEPRNVWHDPEGRIRAAVRALGLPGELTGTMVCFARDEAWARRIAIALNQPRLCPGVNPETGERCGLIEHSSVGHHWMPDSYFTRKD